MYKCSIIVIDRRVRDEGMSVRHKFCKNFQEILDWIMSLNLPTLTYLTVFDGVSEKVLEVFDGEIKGEIKVERRCGEWLNT